MTNLLAIIGSYQFKLIIPNENGEVTTVMHSTPRKLIYERDVPMAYVPQVGTHININEDPNTYIIRAVYNIFYTRGHMMFPKTAVEVLAPEITIDFGDPKVQEICEKNNISYDEHDLFDNWDKIEDYILIIQKGLNVSKWGNIIDLWK